MNAAVRLPYGTRKNPISVGYVIELSSKESVNKMARTANMSVAAFIEHMIAHVETELNEDGIPTWMAEANASKEGGVENDAA